MFVKNFILILICLIPFNSAFATIEIMKIGPNLSHPWGISFLDNNNVIITERGGHLSIINLKTGKLSKINNTPKVFNVGQGGLLDVHVERLDGKINIYLCYSKFDPPVKSYTILEKSVFDKEYASTKKFITQAKNHLKDHGRLLIGFSTTLGKFDIIEKLLHESNFKIKLIVKEKSQELYSVFFELFEATLIN